MDNKIALLELEDMIAKLQKENENLKEELEQKVEFENHAINKHISELSFENKQLKNQLEHGSVSITVAVDGIARRTYSKEDNGIKLPTSIIRSGYDWHRYDDGVLAHVEKELAKRLVVVLKEG